MDYFSWKIRVCHHIKECLHSQETGSYNLKNCDIILVSEGFYIKSFSIMQISFFNGLIQPENHSLPLD